MKPIVISSCLALAVLPLFAAAPQAANQTAAQPAAHAQTLLSSPQPSATVDSPLVRAAKATNRLGKRPAQVITNDTLVRQGGHFTTTTSQPPPAQPIPQSSNSTSPSFDQLAANAQRARIEAASAAQRAKKADDEKRVAAGRAAGRVEGDTPELFYGDPAAVDGPPKPMKPATPETMGQQKPPL